MSYAKFDDLYDDKPKIREAWRAFPANPIGLHVMAITYCQRHRTDGCLPDVWIADHLRDIEERQNVLAAMVTFRLFDSAPHALGEYRVHDFLDWNESAGERAKRSQQARIAGRQRWKNS